MIHHRQIIKYPPTPTKPPSSGVKRSTIRLHFVRWGSIILIALTNCSDSRRIAVLFHSGTTAAQRGTLLLITYSIVKALAVALHLRVIFARFLSLNASWRTKLLCCSRVFSAHLLSFMLSCFYRNISTTVMFRFHFGCLLHYRGLVKRRA